MAKAPGVFIRNSQALARETRMGLLEVLVLALFGGGIQLAQIWLSRVDSESRLGRRTEPAELVHGARVADHWLCDLAGLPHIRREHSLTVPPSQGN